MYEAGASGSGLYRGGHTKDDQRSGVVGGPMRVEESEVGVWVGDRAGTVLGGRGP